MSAQTDISPGQPSDIEQLCRCDFDELYRAFFQNQCPRTARAIEAAYAFWRQQLGQEAAYAIKVAAVRAHNDGVMSGARTL